MKTNIFTLVLVLLVIIFVGSTSAACRGLPRELRAW